MRLGIGLAMIAAVPLAACGSNGGTAATELAAADDQATCAAPDVQARLSRALAPDTAEIKRRAAAGDYPLKPADIDSLAAGLSYQFDGATTAGSAGGVTTCTARLSVSSLQYGVTTDQPIPLRYTVTRGAGGPDVALGGNARAVPARILEQVAAKLSDVFLSRADQERAASQTQGLIADPNALPNADPLAGIQR